jgi:uncharacterized protein YutE (UPF0331/DUF86 family)
MRFDSARVEKLLASFRQAVAQLKRLRKMKRETFLGDPDKVASAKYHFIMAIEAALDTAHHLIAKNEWRLPKDYADTFSAPRLLRPPTSRRPLSLRVPF